MAPSTEKLEDALKAAARRLYGESPEGCTVNAVRKSAEGRLNLDAGFFKDGEWKAKSKEIIRVTVAEYEEAAPSSPTPSPAPAKKNGVKRRSTEENASPVKKRAMTTVSKLKARPKKKRAAESDSEANEKPAKKSRIAKGKKKLVESESDSEIESELSEEDDANDDFMGDETSEDDDNDSEDYESEEEYPKKAKPKPTKAAGGRNAKFTSKPQPKAPRKKMNEPEDEEDAESSLSDFESSRGVTDNRSQAGEESELSDVKDDEPKTKPKPKTTNASNTESGDEADIKGEPENKDAADDSDSSAISSVIDEAPARKGKSKGGKAASKPKTAKPKASAKSDASSPDEQEIKKLQGNLVKCGVRKIWGFELKKYGDDSKAKIRHLRNMLKGIGMDGRFSEARARETKEARELAAELGAIQEGEQSWGMGSGRASRSRASKANVKSFKEASDGDEDNDDEGAKDERDASGGDEEQDSDEDGEVVVKSRRSAKYKADLAFLGDDDSEDSD